MSRNQRQYNFIYNKLVQEPDDIIGLVAYGLYKQKKVDFILNYKEEHGVDPSENELAIFHEATCTLVEVFRSDADSKMEAVVKKTYAGLLQQAQDVFDKELKERLKGSLVSGILASFLGSIVTALAIVIFYYCTIGIRLGWEGLYRAAVVDVTVQQEQATPIQKPDLNYTALENATSE